MTCAYNPGLQVREWAALRKERRLPITGNVLVKPGTHVEPGDTVAEAVLRGSMLPVNVADSLGVVPAEVPSLLLKQVGDTVSEGELIARTKGLFGLLRAECRAPVGGVVAAVSPHTGQLLIEGPPLPVQVKAYVSGVVAEVLPGRGAIIATGGTLIQGIFGIGGETHGPIVLAVSAPVEVLSEKEITPAMAGRVVVGGSLVTAGALRRAVQIGVAALVTGGLRAQDLRDFLEQEIGAAVTGSEQAGLTIVVTEGFGAISMARRTFRLLGEKEGFVASVSGVTQIRAGVVRPEIIIPGGLGERTAAVASDEGTIAVGSRVRMIRAPHFGALGVVAALPPELQRIESGALVRVLEADLESGVRVTVPRSNVEIAA